MTAPGLPYVLFEGGATLVVRLTPRAAKDEIDGQTMLADGRSALAVRVRKPPVDGAANAGLIALLAKRLGIRKTDITLAAGSTARLKRLDIRGDCRKLDDRLHNLLRRI